MSGKSIALSICLLCALSIGAGSAWATSFTRTSPTSKGAMPNTVSEIGGIVVDLVGLNDVRVVAQLSASSLYVGFSGPGVNPLLIGTQGGFTDSVTDALGGGLSEMAVRITLYDGDTGPGDFDDNRNDLLINGLTFQDFSDVIVQETTSDGLTLLSSNSSGGFRNQRLDTGWFYSNDAGMLSSIFSSIASTDQILYELDDVDPDDNFFDFTQGIDNSLIDVGEAPVITDVVPEPITMLAVFGGLGGLGGYIRRRRCA